MSARKIGLMLIAGWSLTGPSSVEAQQFYPPLGEAIDWIVAQEPETEAPPADSPIRTQYTMESTQPIKLLNEVPGRPLHDLDKDPIKFAWWKVPIYTLLGFPRDLIDGGVGVIGKIPVLNIPVTGLAYEVVPTQVFIRHHRDWHHWPGTRNKNKHGWIDSESWGWFPSLNQTEFRYMSEKKLERLTTENVEIAEELAQKNVEIERHNGEIAQRQKIAREGAILAMDEGRFLEAVERMVPYAMAYPRDESARALLIKSLALYGDEAEPWVRGYLWHEMIHTGLRTMAQSETLLAAALEQHPNNATLHKALILARTRLENFSGAYAIASQWAADSPQDADRARLAFEAAMEMGQEDQVDESWRKLNALESADDLSRANIRLQLLLGQGGQVLAELVEASTANPNDPYLNYYRGVAHLGAIEQSTNPEIAIEEALAQLEAASLTATFPPLVDRIGQSLSFTRALGAKDDPQEDEVEEEDGFFEMGL